MHFVQYQCLDEKLVKGSSTQSNKELDFIQQFGFSNDQNDKFKSLQFSGDFDFKEQATSV